MAPDATFTLDRAAWVKEDGERWSQVVFWWEWEHVRDVAGLPLRIQSTHNHLIDLERQFPQCPRTAHVAKCTKFAPQCFTEVATPYCKTLAAYQHAR